MKNFKHSVNIPSFDGGANTKMHETDMPLNESPELQNVMFEDYGAVETSKGLTHYNTAVASAYIDGIATYVLTGVSRLLIASNSKVYEASGTTTGTLVSITSADSLFTAGVKIEIHQFENKAYISNGTIRPYVYNGTDFQVCGVAIPTQVLTAVTNSAGTLTGTYRYVYAGVKTGAIEGDIIATASDSLPYTGVRIVVSNIPTAAVSSGISYWNVYRNTALASATYYKTNQTTNTGTSATNTTYVDVWLVTAVTNGTTSFVDNNSDSTLITAAPIDNAQARAFKFIQSHQKRVFGAGDPDNTEYVWFSKIGASGAEPEIFPSENFLPIGKGDGLQISGLKIYGDTLIICKSDTKGRTATYALYMPTAFEEDWSTLKISTEEGSESHRGMVNFSNLLLIVNRRGAFGINNSGLDLTSTETRSGSFLSESKSDNIEPEFKDMATGYLNTICGINYQNRIWLAVPSTSSSVNNDKIFIFDYVTLSKSGRKEGAWSFDTGVEISQFCIHNNNLYGASSLASGEIFLMNTGYNKHGDLIASKFKTAAIFGKPEHRQYDKDFRTVYIIADTSGAWMLRIEYYIDSGTTQTGYANLDLTPVSSLWGTAVWGTSVWGGASTRKRYRINLRGASGKYIQFKFFTNGIDKYFKVHELEVYYNVRGLRN